MLFLKWLVSTSFSADGMVGCVAGLVSFWKGGVSQREPNLIPLCLMGEI